MYPQEINLVSVSHSQDDIGQDIKTKTSRSVMAEVYDVGANFKMSAQEKGIFLEWRVLVWSFEYDNEPIVEIKGEEFKVFKNHYRDDGKIELTLEKVTGNG